MYHVSISNLEERMKKRYVIAFILTIILIIATNQFWLCKSLVDIKFNLYGNQNLNIIASLGSKSSLQKVDLTSDNAFTFRINKKGHFDFVTITFLAPKTNETLIFSNLRIKKERLKANDLNKFTITGAKYKIIEDKLIISPNSDEVVLYYPIKGSPSTTFQFDIFLSILILGFLLSLKLSNYLANFNTVKNASTIDIAFLTVFLVTLFIPMSHLNPDETSKTENRTLANKPTFTQVDGRINYEFGKQFEDYFNDRFALRVYLVNLNTSIKFLNSIIDNSKAFYIKKNNWFGSKSGCETLFKSKNQLETVVEHFDEINKFCKENNIKFYVLLVPTKEMVYKNEIQPFILNSTIEKNNKDIEYLKKHSKATIIYPYKELKAEADNGNYVFFKSEHHWTQYGAYIGYLELMKELKKDYPNIKILSLKNDYKMTYNKKVNADFDRSFQNGETLNLIPALNKYSEKFLDTNYKYYGHINKNLLSEEIQKKDFLGRIYYYPKGYNLRVLQTGTSMNESLDNFLPYQFKNLKYIRLNSSLKVKDVKEELKLLKYHKETILKFKPNAIVLCYTIANFQQISELEEKN